MRTELNVPVVAVAASLNCLGARRLFHLATMPSSSDPPAGEADALLDWCEEAEAALNARITRAFGES